MPPVPSVLGYTDTSALARLLTDQFRLAPRPWTAVDVNRAATRLTSAFLRQKRVAKAQLGFTWEAADNTVGLWFPQGITELRQENPPRRYLVVSWYGKGIMESRGVRLTLVNITDPNRIRYRHVLLVQPSAPGSPFGTFKPIVIHAGGLAARDNLLFVADTVVGARVFDMNVLFAAEADPRKELCGIVNGRAFAFDYRYIVPQLGVYELAGPPRFSWASIDWTNRAAPRLLMGNYHTPSGSSANPPPTLAWWNLDGTTVAGGARQVTHPFTKVQGAVSHGEYVWFSCSGTSPRLLVSRAPFAKFTSFSWPDGCEDLHLSPFDDLLWCLTEFPPSRWVYSVRRSDYLPLV